MVKGVRRTQNNKPINPKRTIVVNKPSTEASKPFPIHTVLPARERRPLPGEEFDDVGVGFDDEGYTTLRVCKERLMPKGHHHQFRTRVSEGLARHSRIHLADVTFTCYGVAFDRFLSLTMFSVLFDSVLGYYEPMCMLPQLCRKLSRFMLIQFISQYSTSNNFGSSRCISRSLAFWQPFRLNLVRQ
jgi:hypothetical protein